MKRWLILATIGLILVVIGWIIYFFVVSNSSNIQSPSLTNNNTQNVGQQNTGQQNIGQGWLTAKGTNLVDDNNNNIVRFTSVGFKAESKDAMDTDTSEYDKAASWGFNSVRLSTNWGALQPNPPTTPGGGWDQEYLGKLDFMIQEMNKRNMRVIIGIFPHFSDVVKKNSKKSGGFPNWLYPDQNTTNGEKIRCDFFRNITQKGVPLTSIQDGYAQVAAFLAQRYKDNPMVSGIDMINEPYPGKTGADCTYATFLSNNYLGNLYQRVGAEVRKVNPKILLIFEEVNVVHALSGEFTLTNPPSFSNVVYDFHLYPRPSKGQTFLETIQNGTNAFWDRAKKWNVPLWMGEFNAFDGGANTTDPTLPNDPNWQNDLKWMMDYYKQQGIGWNFLAFKSSNSLVDKTTGAEKIPLVPILQSGMDSTNKTK